MTPLAPSAAASRRDAVLLQASGDGEELDDDACLAILEPYRGHRFRVQMLLSMVARRRPRRGPRMALPTHTPYATRGSS
jgi:hypothetical protein